MNPKDPAVLKKWIAIVEKKSEEMGLSLFAQEFIVCSREQAIEHLAHRGGYNLYPHWSFGKSKFISKILFDHRVSFLPNELFLNTNPAIATLLETNSLVENIIIAAHVYAHNDFSKNNVAFRVNKPEIIREQLKRGSQLMERLIQNPEFGPHRVEKLIDAAHSVLFTVDNHRNSFLDFVILNFHHLSLEELEVLQVVRLLARHLWPNLETKIIDEGWAAYWQIRILETLSKDIVNELGLDAYSGGIDFHWDVLRMPASGINPYRVGFFTWQKARKELGSDAELFRIRKDYTDLEFLSRFFNNDGNFIYDNFVKPLILKYASNKVFTELQIQSLIKNYRNIVLSSQPEQEYPRFTFAIEKSLNEKTLVLYHLFDGRILDQNDLRGTLQQIHYLWKGPIRLETRVPTKRKRKGRVRMRRKIYACNEKGNVYDKN